MMPTKSEDKSSVPPDIQFPSSSEDVLLEWELDGISFVL